MKIRPRAPHLTARLRFVPGVALIALSGATATLVAVHPAAAQAIDETNIAPHNLSAFEPLDLPTPNRYRSAAGEPGEAYWQQRADYRIQVALEPEANRVSGTETITYTNNSPDSLRYLWLQLDQDLFDPESRAARLAEPGDRFRGAFPGGGFDISRVALRGADGGAAAADYLLVGESMRIALDSPLSGGGSTIDIVIDFAFSIPQYGADRMGRLDVAQGTVYEIAQWYPRMYVYDDVNGWNTLPYLGIGEWYLEYGVFDVEITVPRDFIVVATGVLRNSEQVLTAEQRARLDRARGSAETVTIIGADEVGEPGTQPSGNGPLTWHFRADSVRDFSWAASEAFIWDAASAETGDGHPALVMSAYPREGIAPGQTAGWERATQFGRHSISFYSDFVAPYPYPVAINVAGVAGGMEYPMVVFCSVEARGADLFGVTDHELGHQWFPMMVGSNERRFFWMDEGLNTFMNRYSARRFYGPEAAAGEDGISAAIARAMESAIADEPILTYADRLREQGYGFLAYRKPGRGLVLLREYILGPERFDSAFREYFRRWRYRHPWPADFFRTIENVAGEELDWFWRGWFAGTGTFDVAVADVEVRGDSTFITVENQGALVMPVELRIAFADGSTVRRRIPVEAWYIGDRFTLAVTRGEVAAVATDPEGWLPDVDPEDDAWTAAGS